MSCKQFLENHKLSADCLNPVSDSVKMMEHMLSGLNGNIIDMPMIKTYLKIEGEIREGSRAIVIDAGGTNFRCGVATFENGKFVISDLNVSKMPGVDQSASWEEFISFVADSLMPIIDMADVIGFCFSYAATITPEVDAIVKCIDKEVKIDGCEGKLVGASLIEELERRGKSGKRCVILNDTVAALLGGSASLNKSDYSDYIGMICGTGFNTCARYNEMLINLESGFYNGFVFGDIDAALDSKSAQPGEKLAEKMTSGAYLGTICALALDAASDEGYIDMSVKDRISEIEDFNGAVVDELSCGEDKHALFTCDTDLEFARELCLEIFERSARVACTTIIALMRLTSSGKEAEKPCLVCAEGSLIGKSRHFLSMLESDLEKYALNELGLHAKIVVGSNTTLPGSAAAAILNA